MTSINLVKQLHERQNAESKAQESASSSGLGARFSGAMAGELSKEERVRLILMVVGLGCVFGARFVIGAYVVQQETEARNQVAELDQQIQEENRQVGSLSGIKAEIDSFEAKMTELREKLNIIEGARKNRNSVVRMVDFIVNEMPASIWLSKITLDNSLKTVASPPGVPSSPTAAPGAPAPVAPPAPAPASGPVGPSTPNSVSVFGYATSLQVVSEFMKRLEGAVFFPRWELVQTEDSLETSVTPTKLQRASAKEPVLPADAKKFEINARVVSP